MKRLATVIAFVALLAAPAACGGDDKPGTSGGGAPDKPVKKATLTLNWVAYGEHAPFYYGVKKGFYTAEGIDLQIQPGKGSGATVQAVDQKNTTFGWADTPPLLNGVGTGMKVKSVGVFLQKGPASIEFLADKNITKPADLKGKTIGGTPGDALYSTFPAWLKANGMQPSDVKVVNVDAASKIAALAEGRVDAIMGFFHDQGPTIEARTGKKVGYLLWADWGLNMLGTGIVVHNETISSDAELVKAFVRATQKSWAEAAKDIPGAASAMAEMAENEPPQEVLVKQLTLAIPLLDLDKAGAPGVNEESKWAETIDLMKQNANLKEPGPASKYWDGTYAKKS
jgi:ABC-type nitrate/sulfonate/bicarbonate transport system substrate-binding protein